MKKILLSAVATVALVFLAGCAQRYVITLHNGHQITTSGKPTLQGGSYVFTDTKGQPGSVPSGRVREVAPASMASPVTSSGH
jgi:hypothetical protein